MRTISDEDNLESITQILQNKKKLNALNYHFLINLCEIM